MVMLTCGKHNNKWVQLDQLGTIDNGFSEPRQSALLNGKPVVAFQVVRANINEIPQGRSA